MNTAAAEKTLNSISPSSAAGAAGGGGHWSVKQTVHQLNKVGYMGQTKWKQHTIVLWSPFADSFTKAVIKLCSSLSTLIAP